MKAHFSDLPQPLQEELSKYTKTGDFGPTKFYLTEGTGGKMFAVIFGILCLGVIGCFAVMGQQWEFVGALVAGGISSLFMMMVLFNFVRRSRYRRSKSKPGIVANPL